MLESLPIYIISCLEHHGQDSISEYEEIKLKTLKYYICEFVVQLMIFYHEKYRANKDVGYYHTKVAIKVLIQNIFEDLGCYVVPFLTSLWDTISEYIRSEIPEDQERNDSDEMMSLNNDICTLLITLLHNLNQRTYGVVEFQKLEIPKSTLINKEESKEQVSKTNEIFKAKQLIDQYFKIYQNKKDQDADEKVAEERNRINNSAMKLVLWSHSITG